MPKLLTPAQRAKIMSSIRSRGNQSTEIAFMRALRAGRITGWRRHSSLPGRPDFSFSEARLVVFIDGCFWHRCPIHGNAPTTNVSYWTPKIAATVARDLKITRLLRRQGYTVLRFWEHDVQARPAWCIRRAQAVLAKKRREGSRSKPQGRAIKFG